MDCFQPKPAVSTPDGRRKENVTKRQINKIMGPRCLKDKGQRYKKQEKRPPSLIPVFAPGYAENKVNIYHEYNITDNNQEDPVKGGNPGKRQYPRDHIGGVLGVRVLGYPGPGAIDGLIHAFIKPDVISDSNAYGGQNHHKNNHRREENGNKTKILLYKKIDKKHTGVELDRETKRQENGRPEFPVLFIQEKRPDHAKGDADTDLPPFKIVQHGKGTEKKEQIQNVLHFRPFYKIDGREQKQKKSDRALQ